MRRALLAAPLALALAACAGPRGRAASTPAAAPAVEAPPEEVVVGAEDLELSGRNDEELFAIGRAAFAAGDHARAANAFGRVADLHPASRHHAAALYDAGLALQRLGEWRLALARFRRFQAEYEGPDAVEAAFREAECHWQLGAPGEALAALERILAADGLAPELRVRALVQRGVVLLEARALGEAERSLREALAAHAAAERAERLDPHDAAQAEFYLGEVSRARFDALALFPAGGAGAAPGGEAALARALEEKSRLLLSAQGHYLRAVRAGHAGWAVAAGERIGALYDALHAALVGAPDPPGLSAEEREAYRREVRRRTRVLASKAISAYEQTLAAARRAGAEGRHVERAEASLARLKGALAGEGERPGGEPPR